MRFSAEWFTLGFAACYVLVFAFEWPVLAYYPLTGRWSFADLFATDGTVMHWYGLTLSALLAGGLLSVCCSPRWLPTVLSRHGVAVVWAAIGLTVYLLRSFFDGVG